MSLASPGPLTRRRLLAGAGASCIVAAVPTRQALAAPYAADGPARTKAGALKAVLLDIARAGQRLVAVGERGHVLLSDDWGQRWRQAQAVPTRTTLTSLHATDARTLWTAGHGGVILRSDDAGERWVLVAGRADGPDVLLSLRVDADGRGLAVGGFGVALATGDGGKTWSPVTLLEGEAGEKHFNRIFISRSGAWLIAAEGGQVLRSDGRGPVAGMAWTAVRTPYKGSLWTGLSLADGSLLAGGMRGNVLHSRDDGLSWAHRTVAGAGSLTGGALLPDGRPLLVGVDGTVVLGDRAGEVFRLQRLDDRTSLTAAVVGEGGAVVACGVSGPRRLELAP